MSVVETVEGQVQLSVRLPKELLKRAKRYALDNDTSCISNYRLAPIVS